MPTPRTFQLDIDTRRYINRVNTYRLLNGLGNLLPPDISDIDNFVIGLKDLGIWGNTICWLMGAKYNVGAGTTVLSIGSGVFDGIFVSTPVWTSSGILFADNTTQAINTSLTYESADSYSLIAAYQSSVASTTNGHVLWANRNSNSAGTSVYAKFSRSTSPRVQLRIGAAVVDGVLTSAYDSNFHIFKTLSVPRNGIVYASLDGGSWLSGSVAVSTLPRPSYLCLGNENGSLNGSLGGVLSSVVACKTERIQTADAIRLLIKSYISKELSLP